MGIRIWQALNARKNRIWICMAPPLRAAMTAKSRGVVSCESNNLAPRQSNLIELSMAAMIPSRSSFLPTVGVFVAAMLLLIGVGQAQSLVYELRFEPEEGSVNFQFYSGAYLILPVNGGGASVILTTEDGGRYFAVSENSARYFVAANSRGRHAVVSAMVGNGTAQAFYTASGVLNGSVPVQIDGVHRMASVAGELKGRLMAADDESGVLAPAADGSLGMIGSAKIRGTLRRDLTNNANNAGLSQQGAVAYVVELLQKYGYNDEATATVESDPVPINNEAGSSVEGGANINPILFPPGGSAEMERQMLEKGVISQP